MLGPSSPRASLLEIDPDLGRDLDAEQEQLARTRLIVRLERLPTGIWHPERTDLGEPGGFGLLVAEGFLIRKVTLEHRAAAELLGPGDLLRPWQEDEEHAAYPLSASWRTLEPVTLAVLDAPATARLCAFPPLVTAILSQMTVRSRRQVGYLVLAQLASVEHRLLLALWHLADIWGRVRPDGIVMPVPLTHEMLGMLVGARRPSVTAALGGLADRGLITAEHGGGWVLHGDPPADLDLVRGHRGSTPA